MTPGAGRIVLRARLDRERAFFVLLAAAAVLRILALFAAGIGLGPDEAQYWFWAQKPAFGYYSKPPLIAWAIGLTTAVFGDAEWAVRFSAPLFHTGAATFVFLIAKHAFDVRTAFWAGAAYAAMPGVSLSAALMTTDAPLLFFWCAALYFLYRLIESWRDEDHSGKSSAVWAALLGGAVGLGFLSKYAMVYFLLGLPFAAAGMNLKLSQIRISSIALAVVSAAIFIVPNIIWNLENDFSTISHTVDNANWTGASLKFLKMGEFIAAQFGVAGPVIFAFAVYGAWLLVTRPKENTGHCSGFFLGFFLPALGIVVIQALISRAHANWAAVSLPAASIIAAAWALNIAPPVFARIFKAGVAATAVVGIALMIAFGNIAIIDAVGASNAIKPLRGWRMQGAEIAHSATDYDAIMGDDREIIAAIAYYARKGPRVVAWNPNNRIDNHYEAFFPYTPDRDCNVLYVTTYADAAPLHGRFASVAPLGQSVVQIGPSRTRTLHLFAVEHEPCEAEIDAQ